MTRWLEKNRYAASRPALSNTRGRLTFGFAANPATSTLSRLFRRSSLKFESATSQASATTSIGAVIRSFDHTEHLCSTPTPPDPRTYFDTEIFAPRRVDDESFDTSDREKRETPR